MDEEQFCQFYEQTARNLRAYLTSMVFNPALVDDLLQDSYFRLLKADLPVSMDITHRKNYLYRIATNLIHDHRRARQTEQLSDDRLLGVSNQPFERVKDIRDAFNRLNFKERKLLWLAYVERFSHEEIAVAVSVKEVSVRPMLARIRRKFADLLKRRGYGE